ncbi:MAG: polyhydroxyalkanoate depolymerase [Alphaproteobacteria bacterium]|nr:polyhydroxyalkanoate depolymerase [Alphaproteobacteria bacterium]
MLYDAYQAQNDIFGPIRLMAGTASEWLGQSWLPIGDMPFVRSAAAVMELLSHAGLSHQRPAFRIDQVTIDDDKQVAVREEIVATHPFCSLVHFRKELMRDEPTVLVVAPLSGHFPTLLRGTVETLLPDHNVYLTDWANARDVPLLFGRFDLDDFVEVLIRFVHLLGRRTHVIAVCQPSVPVLAAVSLMAADHDPCQPASMILMGGPIDTRANPTAVNRFAMAHTLDWFERTVITTVPARYPGAFRRVYPGFLQLAGFLSMNFDRHVSAHWTMFRDLVRGSGESAAATREFYDEYTAVMDLPADFYLQTVERVFHRHDLPLGQFRVRGHLVEPAAIEHTALMTIEGERDDVCGPGQTVAAHNLCTHIPPARKTHHLQLNVGHYGVFHGRRWQSETYPKVKSFIRTQG